MIRPDIFQVGVNPDALEVLNTIYKEGRPAGHLWFDTGCKRGVAGPVDHSKLREKLKTIGLKPLQFDKQEEFIFGDAKTSTSDCCFIYPSFQVIQVILDLNLNLSKILVIFFLLSQFVFTCE